MNFFARFFGRKASEARTALTITQIGQPQQTPKNYKAFAEEGYQKNVVAFKCVQDISSACSSVPWEIYKGKTKLETHPLLDLLEKPNAMQGGSAFFEAVVAYYSIAGNTYIEASKIGNESTPRELWPVRPDMMKVIPGQFGLPAAYQFESSGQRRVFVVDITGKSNICHMKTFHPTNAWYGLSPIEAAMLAIDQHNAAAKWNLALLQNMAAPSGAISVKDSKGNTRPLTDEQFNRIQHQIDDMTGSGSKLARPLVLEGGMQWQTISLSPTEMSWLEGKNTSARDVCLAFGVPPLLLNIPGDSTYSNYKEARLAFYEETVLPTMDTLRSELNRWLVPMYGDGLYLDYCKNKIDPLMEKRLGVMAQVDKLTFISTNEKREMSGLEPVEGGDDLEESSEATNDDGDEQAPENEDQEQTSVSQEDQDIPEEEEKQINPFGKGDRVRIWKSMNARRNKLIRAMEMDVQDEYKELAQSLGKINTTDNRTAEFHAQVAIEKMSRDLMPQLERHLKRAYSQFGLSVISSAKGMESKADTFQKRAAEWAKKRAASAVSEIEGTNIKLVRSKIRAATEFAIENGLSSDAVGQELSKSIANLSVERATMIARTEIGVASNQGSLEGAKELGIPGLQKEWVAVNDDRTRDAHSEISGQRVALDEKFQVGNDEMDAPGDPSASAENIVNCILPGQNISGYFIAGVKSEYIGTVIKLKTKAGRVLTVTPNHPIATDKGFVGAQNISCGDNLICDLREVGNIVGSDDNIKNEPSSIENVFHSIEVLGNSASVNLSVNDLHGDARNVIGKVNVVSTNGELLTKLVGSFANGEKNFGFISKDTTGGFEDSLSTSGSDSVGVNHATPSNPTAFHLPFNEDGVTLNANPFSGLSFGLASNMDASLLELSSNRASVDPKLFRDIVDRHSAVIFFDPVVDIVYDNYSGHVYDLQSNSGAMIAQGIITSNCRCVLVYSRGDE